MERQLLPLTCDQQDYERHSDSYIQQMYSDISTSKVVKDEWMQLKLFTLAK